MLSVTWWLVEDPASEQGVFFEVYNLSTRCFIQFHQQLSYCINQVTVGVSGSYFVQYDSFLGGILHYFHATSFFCFVATLNWTQTTGISVITWLCGYSSSSQQVFVGCTVLWLLHCWYIIDYVSERIRWDTWADTRRTAGGSSLSGWLIWFGVHTFGVAVWKFLDIVDFITHLSFLCICAGSGRV